MAMKKIRLDFTKVEERSGWNTRAIPEGLHKMKIESVQETEAGDGTAMLVYALKPVDGKYKSRLFPFYCKLQQNQYWKLRDLLVAAGQAVPKKAMNIDPSIIVGKIIAAEVEDESNAQYAGRSTVNGTYGLDILDEDGDDVSDDDDEEYEVEEDEEAEDEEDEEELDLESMSIAELRTLAKSLDIATAGLKKADLIDEITDAQGDEEEEDEDEDEDDLTDEDLEEEEYEDDEEEDEEEEPAPKRKTAAKAPVRKAAAPAKRVVKRR